MNRKLEYTILDVFAEHPLEGNPLAVFHDGRGLSDAQMQAIARRRISPRPPSRFSSLW